MRLAVFEQTGRGLAAGPTGLPAGVVALRIPVELVITAERARKHALLGPLLVSRGDIHEDVLVALALLLEESDAWRRYRPLLPQKPPSALLWTPTQLQRMSGTPLPEQVEAVRSALREAHAALWPALQRVLPSPAQVCWERFLWAYCIVESRGLMLALRADGVRRTCLVPYVDMCNHSPSAALAWPTLSPTGGASAERAAHSDRPAVGHEVEVLELTALRDVAAGHEVCLYYGRLPGLQTLQYHGFLDEALLPWEVIQVDLGCPDEVMDFGGEGEAGQEGQEGEVAAAAAEQQSLRMRLLESHGLCVSPHFLRDHGAPSSQLLRALRVLCMDEGELHALAACTAAEQAHALEFEVGLAAAGLRSIAEGLAEGLAAGGAAGGGEEGGAEGDATTDAAIEAYRAFQRRVLWHTLQAADDLEASAMDPAAARDDEEEEEGRGEEGGEEAGREEGQEEGEGREADTITRSGEDHGLSDQHLGAAKRMRSE